MKAKHRIAVIGDTRRGGYGHGLSLAGLQFDNAEVVAVADPDSTGLKQAILETGARQGYADYQVMLQKEKFTLACVGPRWTDQREAMIYACIDAGCNIYCEKPFARDLASADRMLAAAKKAGVKIAVAHQAVYLPQIRQLRTMIHDGLIGEPQLVWLHGKQGSRGGGEDMLVLGCHQFNLLRFFFGQPQWMWSRIRQSGRELASGDVHEASEPVGPVAGDEIFGFYQFPGNLNAIYQSRCNPSDGGPSPYGIEIVGSRGRIAFDNNRAVIHRGGAWAPWSTLANWTDLALGAFSLRDIGNRNAIVDLLMAIEKDQEPACDAKSVTTAMEMIFATYHSQIQGRRISFPLAQREHPLDEFSLLTKI